MDLPHRPPARFRREKFTSSVGQWTMPTRKALALLALALFVGGCAQDAEDRAFFSSGWLSPEAGANRRLGTEPN